MGITGFISSKVPTKSEGLIAASAICLTPQGQKLSMGGRFYVGVRYMAITIVCSGDGIPVNSSRPIHRSSMGPGVERPIVERHRE